MGTPDAADENHAEEEEVTEDAQDQIDHAELQARVNRAIALAAQELEESNDYEDTQRLEIIQRAHVRSILTAHEDARSPLQGDVEGSLADLMHSEKTLLGFASEVEEIDAELTERTTHQVGQEQGMYDFVGRERKKRDDGRTRLQHLYSDCLSAARASASRVVETGGSKEAMLELEERVDDLRQEFVRTKLKNAIRLKKMQIEGDTLAYHLAASDIGAASLKAELEANEWAEHGSSGFPLHQQGLIIPQGGFPAKQRMGAH